ncbi:signal transduction protein [Levilactobacillus namurensis]|uniref:signal transduction protein n=1 Tax=Levilactobacillus namurensis TaxID=380393 RepID=UPI001D3E5A79|nr:signal transduction protein [Levilactobacillus namurensis]HJE46016.1 signal transduction protein [Levilactobacillus namurensis]
MLQTWLIFGMVNLVMTYWFVYFQYYWFPQLQPKHMVPYAITMAGAYTVGAGLVLAYLPRGIMLPIIGLLVVEVVRIPRRHRASLPSFLSVSILAYLAVEVTYTASVAVTMLSTTYAFTRSLRGMVTAMVFVSVLCTALAVGLWQTRAPMENLIQGTLRQRSTYLLLALMVTLLLVFCGLEMSLQLLPGSRDYVIFVALMGAVLIIGIALGTYILMLTHLQRERARAQRSQQQFQELYSTELENQMAQVRRFHHDYQNMLLGLGGYLADQDYASFRQLYVDIRSKWVTSNAADLTIEDLNNVSRESLRYQIYHHYLLARQQGVQVFVVIPRPITTTVALLRQLDDVVGQTIPLALPVVALHRPATMTLELQSTSKEIVYRLIFPVPEDTQVTGYHLVNQQWTLDFKNIVHSLRVPVVVRLQLKRHWAELVFSFPRN